MTREKTICHHGNGRMSPADKGFTLLEILIAVLILTIGMVGTAGLLAGVIRTDHLSNKMTTATTLAKEKIEEIRQAGYLGVPLEGSPVTENPVAGFTRVTTTQATGTDGARAVTVSVSYVSFGTHNVELKTVVSR